MLGCRGSADRVGGRGVYPKYGKREYLSGMTHKYFDSECSVEVLHLFAKLTRYNHCHMLELTFDCVALLSQ